MSLKEWWSRQSRLTESQAMRWEKKRDRGRSRFVIVNGVVGWGVCGGVLTAVVAHLVESTGSLPLRLAINMVVFPLGGVWFGNMMWNQMEGRYAEWRRRVDQSGHA